MNENVVKETAVILEIPANDMVSITEICRLCASQNDKLIGIYSEEGISNELGNKMNLYLPIKVYETDELPLQCCWNCASTVLAWHDLVVASAEADRRLRSYQFLTTKEIETGIDYIPQHSIIDDDITDEHDTSMEERLPNSNDSEGVVPEQLSTSLDVFCQNESVSHSTDSKPPKVKGTKRKKKPKTLLSDYFPSNDITNLNDTFENYIKDIQQPFITENSLTESEQIINDDIGLQQDEDDKKPCYHFHNNDLEIKDAIKIEEKMIYNFSCQYCPCLFITEDDIINHVKTDHPEASEMLNKEENILFGNSKKMRRRNNKLDQELINKAKVFVDGRIYYNCKDCGKSLHSPYTYIWHMRIHTGERPFVCDLCGKQFRVSQGLIRHVRETHEGIKNFPCDICGRMFATRRNVEEHRRIHTNERPYICDLCGKSFKQKASLFVHSRSHNDTFPFKCTYCNQGFRTKPPLLLHITRHTGEKPYPCDVCGRCFRIKYELKRHRLIHSDEKPFSCDLCGLSFRQKRYLKNHNKQNHNDVLPIHSLN